MASTALYDDEGFPALEPEAFVPSNPRTRLRRKRALAQRDSQKTLASTPLAKERKVDKLLAKSLSAQKVPKPKAPSRSGAPEASNTLQRRPGRRGRGIPTDLTLFNPTFSGPSSGSNSRVEVCARAEHEGKTARVRISTLFKNRYGAKYVSHSEELYKLIQQGGQTKDMLLQKRKALQQTVSP